ncbi:MAG: hypothetical protein ABI969_08115, partial [bacterium]
MPDSSLDLKTLLLAALAVITVFYVVVLTRGILRARAESAQAGTPTAGGLTTEFDAYALPLP